MVVKQHQSIGKLTAFSKNFEIIQKAQVLLG